MATLLLAGTVVGLAARSAAQSTASTSAGDKKLSGLGVILKVESSSTDPIFEADGYRIRIVPATVTTIQRSLKSITDATAGTWIRFEGRLDDHGVLIATKAGFFPAGFRHVFTETGPRKPAKVEEYKPVLKDSLLDADGHLVGIHTKVRYSDAGGVCGWHRVPADQALQQRIESIGIRVVPAYQKTLPAHSPSRIPFRFYAVDNDKFGGVFACNEGLILVPKNTLARLQNDDQLAALLAEGIAANLQGQLVTITPSQALDMSAHAATLIGGVPGLLVGEGVASAGAVAGHETVVKLEKERARMSLQLLADAGYDPWQAPEAWRLLEPKKRLKATNNVKYPVHSRYQLSVLGLQYRTGHAGGVQNSSTAPTNQ